MKKVLSFVLALAMVMGCVSMAFATAQPFPDAKDNIKVTVLKDLGVLEGDENGKVNLDKTITRAEMCAVLMRILGYEQIAAGFVNTDSGFTDVEKGSWYNGYVTVAYQLGYVSGLGDKKFDPTGNVTYEQGVAFIVKALGYKETSLSLQWPYNHIFFAQRDLKIIDGSISVGTVLTRAQMFDILFNAMDLKTVTYSGDTYTANGKTFAEMSSGVDGTKATVGEGSYTTGRAVVTKEMANNAANATYGSVTVSQYVGKYCELLFKDGKIMQVIGVVNGDSATGKFSYNEKTGEIKYNGKSAGKTISLADENAWKNFYINGEVAGKTSQEAIDNVMECIKFNEEGTFTIDTAEASVIYAKDGSIASFAAIDIWSIYGILIVEADDEAAFKNGSYASVSAIYEGCEFKFHSTGSGKTQAIDGLSVEGKVSKLSDIKTGDIVYIYATVEKYITKLYVSRNVVTATYEGFYKKGTNTYYSFDGRAYKFSELNIVSDNNCRSLNENGAYAIENSTTYVGSSYALYLNKNGEIEAYRNLYEGKAVAPQATTGYAVITKLTSTSESAMVGVIPVKTGMKNDIELFDITSGKTLTFASVSFDGVLTRKLIGQVGEHAYLFSTLLTGWEISYDTLQRTTYNAKASDINNVVIYTLADDGSLEKLEYASEYEYKSDVEVKAAGLTDGKFYPYSTDMTIISYTADETAEVKDLQWLLSLESFDGYYTVGKYGFVDFVLVVSSADAEPEYDVIKVAAVEAVAFTQERYVTLFTGSNKDFNGTYYLDKSNPSVGEIYINVKVVDSEAQLAGATNLKAVTAKLSLVSGDAVTFPTANKYTNVFKSGILQATANDPEIWVYDGANCEYSVFSGTVEAAFKKIADDTGVMNMYDLDKDGFVDFIVVYPQR